MKIMEATRLKIRVIPHEHRKGISSRELTRRELKSLFILTLAFMKEGVPKCFYFGSYSEGKVCINKKGNIWEVYDAENNKVYCEGYHDTCYKACIDLMCRTIDSTQTLGQMVTTFDRLCKMEFTDKELEEFKTYYEFDKRMFTDYQKKAYAVYNKKLLKFVKTL